MKTNKFLKNNIISTPCGKPVFFLTMAIQSCGYDQLANTNNIFIVINIKYNMTYFFNFVYKFRSIRFRIHRQYWINASPVLHVLLPRKDLEYLCLLTTCRVVHVVLWHNNEYRCGFTHVDPRCRNMSMSSNRRLVNRSVVNIPK